MGFAIIDISSGLTIEKSREITTIPLTENNPQQESPDTQIVPFVPDGIENDQTGLDGIVIIQQIQNRANRLI